MKAFNKNWRSGLLAVSSLVIAAQVYGQEVVPAPISEAERARTDISKVFVGSAVGRESATFVDPVAACVRRYDGQTVNGSSVDCRRFQMGSPANEEGRDSDETQHAVRLSNTFSIQATEVTQLQWFMVMKGTNKATPAYFKSDCDTNNQEIYRIEDASGAAETVTICKNHPVEKVSYNDIVGTDGFLARLNASQTQYTYRLPTEAEWEYSARGGELRADGTYPRYSFGDDARDLDLFGYYYGNSSNSTHAVAGKRANGYELYDMHGNVWEWVSDWYDINYGLSAEQLAARVTNPAGPSAGSYRVIRGGGWFNFAQVLLSAFRDYDGPGYRNGGVGFRLVRTAR